MIESKISQSIEETYTKLVKILIDRNCKIVSKEPPYCVRVTQGSLMGISPMSAKKVVSFNLSKNGSETKIISNSQIATDWKNLTLYGNVTSIFVIGIFIWITIDMKNFLETANHGFWTWIVQIFDFQNTWGAIFMINLIQVVTVFLAIVVLIEILIVIYVYPRKNEFSRQILEKLRLKIFSS